MSQVGANRGLARSNHPTRSSRTEVTPLRECVTQFTKLQVYLQMLILDKPGWRRQVGWLSTGSYPGRGLGSHGGGGRGAVCIAEQQGIHGDQDGRLGAGRLFCGQ
jgi:hypothetical protein